MKTKTTHTPDSRLCADCGADLSIEDHRKNCEPYIDDDALWEQHVHDKHVAQEDAMGVPEDQR